MDTRLVGYVRLTVRGRSTSDPAPEVQDEAVYDYAGRIGAEVVGVRCEVEAGRQVRRDELARAIDDAKAAGATLVIPRLGRLAADRAFTSALMTSGVEFVCCDNPVATRSTLPVLAQAAQHEAEQAGRRTKAALAAARARGVKLGSDRPGHWSDPVRAKKRLDGIRKAAKHAAALRSAAARDAYADLEPLLADLWARGLSLRAIAVKVNEQGQRTRKGKPWNPVQVSRVIERMKEKGLLTGEQPGRRLRGENASKARRLFTLGVEERPTGTAKPAPARDAASQTEEQR